LALPCLFHTPPLLAAPCHPLIAASDDERRTSATATFFWYTYSAGGRRPTAGCANWQIETQLAWGLSCAWVDMALAKPTALLPSAASAGSTDPLLHSRSPSPPPSPSSSPSHRRRRRTRHRTFPTPPVALFGVLAAVAASSGTVDGHPLSTLPPPSSLFLCPVRLSDSRHSSIIDYQIQSAPCALSPPTVSLTRRWNHHHHHHQLGEGQGDEYFSDVVSYIYQLSARGDLPDRYIKGDDGRWRKQNMSDMVGSAFCSVGSPSSVLQPRYCCLTHRPSVSLRNTASLKALQPSSMRQLLPLPPTARFCPFQGSRTAGTLTHEIKRISPSSLLPSRSG
jgi:hypothetical protein